MFVLIVEVGTHSSLSRGVILVEFVGKRGEFILRMKKKKGRKGYTQNPVNSKTGSGAPCCLNIHLKL